MSTVGVRDFRPMKHYTAPKGWINDPNGLTYENGTWHLFAQHYPYGTTWGPMHWIHATSRDLLHWENQGIALAPDEELGMIFSGSGVIDKGNTSGLGQEKDPMVLMFTHHGTYEQQSIAFSEDRINYTKYSGNPVIPNNTQPNFRDPKLIRNSQMNCWTAVIAAGDHVEFHASSDLIHWLKTGEFGQSENKLGGIFECPDLVPLMSPDGEQMWVLIASMALPREFGGSRTQYFIGKFDGKTFIETMPSLQPKLIDTGYDNYAAVTFSGAATARLIGWGTSWSYADKEPTGEFCGLMTYARDLSFVKTDAGLRLASLPITPDFDLVEAEAANLPCSQVTSTASLSSELFMLHIEVDGPFCISIFNEDGEVFRFGQDTELRFFTDRTQASQCSFSHLYELGLISVTTAYRLFGGKVSMDMYFDRCIAEIFADKGTYASSVLVFPNAPYTHVQMEGHGKLWVGATSFT